MTRGMFNMKVKFNLFLIIAVLMLTGCTNKIDEKGLFKKEFSSFLKSEFIQENNIKKESLINELESFEDGYPRFIFEDIFNFQTRLYDDLFEIDF